MTRISFIMATYNRAELVAESLGAILPQMDADDEILVVDDGSTDETAAVVRGVASRIRYVRQENAGKSVALNRATAMTDGAYVWICDDDDLLRPGAVALLFGALDGSGHGFVFGRHARFRGDAPGARVDLGTGYWPDLGCGSLVRHVLEDGFLLQNAALVRRSCYDAVGPFDARMLRSLDYEMFVRLVLAAPGAYLDAVIFDQREHRGRRGPARALHAAALSARVRLEYDRRTAERVRDAVPLALYEAMFESIDAQVRRRAALLQRAVVLARHDLWPDALADLEQAARLAGDVALTAIERDICARAVGGKHGFAGALAPPIRARLAALHRRRPLGRTVVRAVLGGTLSRARRGEPLERRHARRLLIGVAGVTGVARLLLARSLPRRGGRQPLLLRERAELPRPPLVPGDPLRP